MSGELDVRAGAASVLAAILEDGPIDGIPTARRYPPPSGPPIREARVTDGTALPQSMRQDALDGTVLHDLGLVHRRVDVELRARLVRLRGESAPQLELREHRLTGGQWVATSAGLRVPAGNITRLGEICAEASRRSA